MENQELDYVAPLKPRKLSTILMGCFLGVMLIICIILIPLDLRAVMNDIKESSNGDAGSAIGGAFAAVIVGALIVLIHAAFIVFIIGCGIMLIFLIKNIKYAEIKGIRIANIIELCAAGVVITISVIKLILLFVR